MPSFRLIASDIRDPYFNLASEEYLLRQTEGYWLYLWRNDPAVIVGVNQNALEEVNADYTAANGIKIVRRLTGVGAVYHDPANVCYTVIAPYDGGQDHYRVFTAPVIEYLNGLGVAAAFSGRNDITVNGLKISGNAETVWHDRILHHGTILFDTDMAALGAALRPNKLKMESKGTKSVRARVTNVKEHLPVPMTADSFFAGLCDFLAKGRERYDFSPEDKAAVGALVREKYATFEWNIGRSPKGKNLFEAVFPFGVFSLCFDTENGVVQNAAIHGDFFSRGDVREFAARLDGVPFERQAFEAALFGIGDCIPGADPALIAGKMFE